MAAEAFDTIVIGAGQAGPFLAARLVAQGRKVALVESRDLGGTCVNRGCTPTKTLRKSARVAHLARRAAEFGVELGPVHVNFEVAMQRMQRRVDESRAGLESWLGGLAGLTIIKAHGRLSGREDGDFLVEAGPRLLRAPRVMLNTGTRPFVPPVPGLSENPYLDNESLLKLRVLPRKLVIIGGGYISLEMGQIFRRLGSKVAIIEAGPRLTAREDENVSAAVADLLRAEGIDLHIGMAVARVLPGETEGGACVQMADGRIIGGSHLLVATGRVPNTEDLGLASVGLKANARGYLATNDRLETDVPGIWALGDINQRGAFTHTSYHDHDIVAENLGGGQRSADARTDIYAMFTDPPLAHVGLHEADAMRLVAQGRRISQAVHAMKDVSRAKEESETQGLIKLLIDEDSGQFLGATMLGIGSDEIIQAIGLVMASKGTWRQVRDALPVHPTVTEFLPTIIDRRKALAVA
jgi:pyruvate/2-oxoglutarate dehydrogenase complex dihydrolipoamide dehydrogenase (E3) component